MKQEEEKCCGNCCWFYGEMTDGNGMCAMHEYDGDKLPWYCCDSSACSEYTSRQEMRHYMAVLLQANRYRRDDNVPSIYRMPNSTDLGKSIDFAYKYMKVFSNL